MSNAARHSFHTAFDPEGVANLAAARADDDRVSADDRVQPAPIVIGSADASRAFDLFQPEPSELSAFDAEPTPSPVVPIADGLFARQVARALDAPQPVTATLNLPLGGVAPTDREIASARALILGWIAACAIALFAFLAQGPTVTTRPEDTAPAPSIEEARTAQPGDIRLDPEAAPKPAAPRPRKATREQAPAVVPSKP